MASIEKKQEITKKMYCNDYDEMISYENEKKITYPTKSKLTIDKFISNRYKNK